jgi:multidrug efflux pump subunit AcrA (membrane-fusion protein)
VQILTIPQAAIIQNQGIYYVFTVANDKVTRHQVEVGATTGDRIEIKSGLQSGDKLAVSNVSQLKDGEVVTIVE